MRLLLFCTTFLFLLGCSKEDFSYAPNSIAPISSILYNRGSTSGYQEQMTYDSEGKLLRVDNFSGNQYMLIEYDNDFPSLINIHRNSDDVLVQRQELTYNEEGQLISMKIRYSGGLVSKDQRITFEYDNKGRRIREDNSHDDYQQYSLYSWKGNNLIRARTYTAEGDLIFEHKFKHDAKKNPLLHFPTQLRNPIYFSENNVTELKFDGEDSLIDVACYTCPVEYEYNSEDLPTSIDYTWGSTWDLRYE